MDTQINHNNSGQKYRIAVDIAKEGSHIWDLTPYFKGRVGDNNFGLQVTWYYQGQLMNVVGMKPYIEGLVGQYSFGKNGEIDMDPDAVPVRYDGSPDDCAEAGKATFYFPSQMFPKEGIFKGFIGVKDDRDGSKNPQISGVTIWFKVLPGIAQIGHACDAYVDELDKALQDFKEKLDEHDKNYQSQLQNVIDDARNAYNTETQNAHDAAIAAQAELNSTREDNNNLADLIQSIENNIKANNIVTRPEYDKLANEIVNRLSQINTKPDYYDNYNSMLAANPDGTQDLCVTADSGEKWLYVNKQWLDLGKFSYADIAPNEKNVFYSPDHDNVLINPDLHSDAYGWGKDSKWEADPTNSVGNSSAYKIAITNYDGHPKEMYQATIDVSKRSVFSAGVMVNTSNIETAELMVLLRDANGQIINSTVKTTLIPQNTQGSFQLVKIENQSIPDNAVTGAITFAMEGNGILVVRRPQFNFEESLLPYSTNELREQIKSDHDNVLINPDLNSGAYGWYKDPEWEANPAHAIGNSMAYGCYVNNAGKDEKHSIYQNIVNVENHDKLSCGVYIQANSLEQGYFKFSFRDANGAIINSDVQVINLPRDTGYKLIKLENIAIPKNAVTCELACGMQGNGLLIVCRPQINFRSLLLPYSIDELGGQIKLDHDNALINPDLHSDAYGWEKDSNWEEDPAHAIGNSMAYGCYMPDAETAASQLMYQDYVSVKKREVLSCSVMVNTYQAKKGSFQLIFRDDNRKAIKDSVNTIDIPENTDGYLMLKMENITIPKDAATCQLTIGFGESGTGLVVFCRPQIVFEKGILPYSEKELAQKVDIVDEKLSSKLQSIGLPRFTFDIDVNKIQDKWITAPFTYNNGNQTLSGYAKISIQGDSSRAYPKKNYKIKIFSDSECKEKIKTKLKSSWTELSNFNLKANWIDATQSRNLVNAHLISNATAVTPIENNDVTKNLIKTQNFGQMEGFPIEVWFGDNYNGLYSCNTKKTDKVFGMDKDIKGTGVISVLDNVPAPDSQLLKVPTAKLDNVAYSDELHDTPDPELVKNWSTWLDFLNNSTDEDFHSKLASYLDINAAINIYLFGVLSREYDFTTKSILFLTWNNGKYYYPIAYDLDSNWGQNFAGKIEGNPQDNQWGFGTETADHKDGTLIANVGWNKLFERLFKLFKPEIKAQYLKLRSTVWRNDQMINAFKTYMNQIPEIEFEKDHKLWNQIPDLDKNNYEQLHQIIIERSNQMDNWIDSLNTTTTPAKPSPQPAQPQTTNSSAPAKSEPTKPKSTTPQQNEPASGVPTKPVVPETQHTEPAKQAQPTQSTVSASGKESQAPKPTAPEIPKSASTAVPAQPITPAKPKVPEEPKQTAPQTNTAQSTTTASGGKAQVVPAKPAETPKPVVPAKPTVSASGVPTKPVVPETQHTQQPAVPETQHTEPKKDSDKH